MRLQAKVIEKESKHSKILEKCDVSINSTEELLQLRYFQKEGIGVAIGKCIGRGNTAEAYEWEVDKILKLFYKSTSELAEKEYRIALHLVAAGVAAPRVFEQIEYEGRTGIVFEQIKGSTMMKRMISRLWNIKQESRQMAKLHFESHQFVATFLPQQTEKFKENIQNAPGLSPGRKDQLLAQLAELDGGNRLCHGDFHPDNVLYSDQGPVVIDWLTATCGNPLADVARTLLMLKYAELPEHIPVVVKVLLHFVREIIHREYLQEYERLANSTLQDVEKWKLIVAAARLIEPVPDDEKTRLIKLIEKGTV